MILFVSLFVTCISVSFSGIGKWLGNIEEFGLPGVPLILLGNKADLEGKREVAIVISTLVIMLVQVERERGEALAREHSMAFLETSARTGVNVAQVSFFHSPHQHHLQQQLTVLNRSGFSQSGGNNPGPECQGRRPEKL